MIYFFTFFQGMLENHQRRWKGIIEYILQVPSFQLLNSLHAIDNEYTHIDPSPILQVNDTSRLCPGSHDNFALLLVPRPVGEVKVARGVEVDGRDPPAEAHVVADHIRILVVFMLYPGVWIDKVRLRLKCCLNIQAHYPLYVLMSGFHSLWGAR